MVIVATMATSVEDIHVVVEALVARHATLVRHVNGRNARDARDVKSVRSVKDARVVAVKSA